ncbi:MAG: hypothetical protein AAGA57_01870 [Planctomycetota bacterium]
MTRFRTSTLISALALSFLAAPNAAPQDAPEEVGLFDDEAAQGAETIEVGAAGEISIDASDVDITTVLRGLSMQAGKNIMISRDVSGSVTFTIRDADFYEALEAILSANGFRYFEQGQFIHVVTEDEYQQRVEQAREVVQRVVRLDYLNAADAEAFVTPLLTSDIGTIITSAETESGFVPEAGEGGEDSYAGEALLVIRDYEEVVDQVVATIDELDIRPKMVLIEATILQATLAENNALGTDFALFFDINGVAQANPLNVVDSLIGGSATSQSGAISTTDIGNTSGDGGFKAGVVAGDAAVFVRALNSITNTTIVSNPKLTVLNRQRGDILVGEQLGYISTTQTEDSVTQTVEFLDVGTQLSVRPFVSEDGAIRLELRPSVSDGATRELAGFVVADSSVAEMTTNVIVRSGQTVVLGGLFTEDIQVDRRQVPGLGDIPFVGNAFRGQDDDTRRSEVIFLVKATILENDALAALGDEAADQARLAQIGAGQGLLPWSRKKLAGAHLRDAADAMRMAEQATSQAEREDFESSARWSANLALHLEPTSVHGLAIKREVDGGAVLLAEESMLDSAINKAIAEELGDLLPAEAIDAPATAPEAKATPAEPQSAIAEAQPEPAPAAEAFIEDIVINAGEYAPEDASTAFDIQAAQPASAEAEAIADPFDTPEPAVSDAEPATFEPTEPTEPAFTEADEPQAYEAEPPVNDPFVGAGFESQSSAPTAPEDVALIELEQAEAELESLIEERRIAEAQAEAQAAEQAAQDQTAFAPTQEPVGFGQAFEGTNVDADATADNGFTAAPDAEQDFSVVSGDRFATGEADPFAAQPNTAFEPVETDDFATFGATADDNPVAEQTSADAEGFWLFDFDSLEPIGQFPWSTIGGQPNDLADDSFDAQAQDFSDIEAQAEADAIAGVEAK